MKKKDLAEIASIQNEILANYNMGFFTYREMCEFIAETLDEDDKNMILFEIARIEVLDEILELRRPWEEKFDEILMENKKIENIITKF